MGARIAQFIAVIGTAIALVPGGAHLLSLPAKMAMPVDPYFVAQQVYRGWAWLGLAMLIAIIANLASAWLTRERPRARVLSALAGLLVAATVVVFFIWTYPANVETGNWTTITDNWQALRRQWEYSHAVNAAVTFVALICATAAILSDRARTTPYNRAPDSRPPATRLALD